MEVSVVQRFDKKPEFYLDTWFPVVELFGEVVEPLGDGVLLEEKNVIVDGL